MAITEKPVNPNLSLTLCWIMVNRIQQGDSPENTIERFNIAKKWLDANKVISNEDYDELMRAATYLLRDAYRMIGLPEEV